MRSSNADSCADSLCKRPSQGLASAIHAFAADVRDSPRSVIAGLVHARKSADNLALVSAKSRSCSSLPATVSATPLLTLVLAGTSFLGTTVLDNGDQLYVIDTHGTRTIVCREDPVQGAAHVGAVDWPEPRADKPNGPKSTATVRMAHGRLQLVDEFIRRTKFSSSRYFNIPHFPYALKWKRSGGLYKLMVSKSKLVVATLEPAVLPASPRIKVFESLYDHDEASPQPRHRGVPIFLLDYIIMTALLVGADKDERLFAGSSSAAGSAAPFRSGAHFVQRWRLDVHTEPFSDFSSRATSPAPSFIGPSGVAMSSSCSEFGGSVSLDPPSLSRNSSFMPPPSQATFSVPMHPFATVRYETEDDDSSLVDDNVINLSSTLSEPPSGIRAPFDGDGYTRGHARMRSASDPHVNTEAPSQSAAGSLQWFSTSSSTSTPQRSSSASATVSSRPFRPLPRIPMPSDIPPVPSLPHDFVRSSMMSASNAYTSEPASSLPTPTTAPTAFTPERSIAGPSHVSSPTSPPTPSAPRESQSQSPEMVLRRATSESTLGPPKTVPDNVSRSHNSADNNNNNNDNNNSLLKFIHRRSLHKRSVHASPPAHAYRTLPETPGTPPLRLRNVIADWESTPVGVGVGVASPSESQSPSSASESAFSPPPSMYANTMMHLHLPPEEDEYAGFCPPPSYDSIDFSRS
ncbi:hypothetical protein M0805_005716 [Coniferiporia weirii]|nr:hypothetical protein M0805_005716 [Coniferiporia weirii]